jgi:hypothetical protein
MRHEPDLREDATNLAIVAGSAMVATLLTAALIALPLRADASRAHTVTVESRATRSSSGAASRVFVRTRSRAQRRTEVITVRDGRTVEISTSDEGDGSGRTVTIRTNGLGDVGGNGARELRLTH